MDAAIARQMARTIEPYHTFIYRVPEALAAYQRLGLDEGRMSYFAPRAAPLGPASAELVAATFFGFNPELVRRSIPEAWRRAAPETILQARLEGADAALRRICGAEITAPSVGQALELARRAVDACRFEGRALSAAHAGLPHPEPPHLALWHAITILREYRTDGHYAALLSAGLDAVESLVMHVAVGGRPIDQLKGPRGWSDEAWEAGRQRLQARGLVNPDGTATERGRLFREEIELCTDELNMAPWRALGERDCERLRDLVRPLSRALIEAGIIPGRSPHDV